METAVSAPARRRGRPPSTSREDIIGQAVALLRAEPAQPLSIHRLARAVGVTPMALYHHVGDKDALLQAVTARLLGEWRAEHADGPWQQRLHDWADGARRHFRRNPALLGLLGWRDHLAGAMLRQIAVLARILEDAGLADAELAHSVQWTVNTLMSAIVMEAAGRQSGVRLGAGDESELAPDDAARVRPLLGMLSARRAAAVFDDHVQRVIEALEFRVTSTGRNR
jgi:AcrR family transcriptional regulator